MRRLSQPDVAIKKVEMQLKATEANYKKILAKAESLEQKAAVYDSDWEKGLNLALSSCTLKLNKKDLKLDMVDNSRRGSAAANTITAPAGAHEGLVKSLKRFPPEAHGSMLT